MNVLDLASGSNMAVTKTSGDESPSFSPNGELIVYATVSGQAGCSRYGQRRRKHVVPASQPRWKHPRTRLGTFDPIVQEVLLSFGET